MTMKNLTKKHKVALIIGVIAFLVNLLTGPLIVTGLCLLALIFIYTDKVKLSRITYGVALIILAEDLGWVIQHFDEIKFMASQNSSDLVLLFLPFITIGIALIFTQNESVIENQNNILSNNYSILKTFQWLVGILTIVSIIIFIVFMVEYGDKLPEEQLFYTIVLFALQVFSSICLILIVKFLFDLDRFKSNYNITDKEKLQ